MRSLSVMMVLLACASSGCAERRGTLVEEGSLLVALDEGGNSVTLRVDGVMRDPKDADGDLFLYELSVRDAVGGFQPFCLPDREGRRLAVPLQGSWDATRTHVASDQITFACTAGAVGKCVRWGYKPWKTLNGVSLAEYHQACVHLTPADYCGDGKGHTRNGTPIDVWDDLGIQKHEDAPGMIFEAAWSPKGAVYLNKPRYGEALSDLVAECPDHLRGRTPLDAPGLDAKAVAARWPEALLFTESHAETELP
jgi:ADYC domain